MADLNFTINPNNESASLSLFLKAVQRIQRLINDVDYAVTRERSSRRWVITQLHSSAPTITVRPLLGDTQTVNAIGRGIHMVTSGVNDPPEYFTEDALLNLKRMKSLFEGKDRAKTITVSIDRVQAATIHEGISKQVERILLAGNESLASVEGRLEAINIHRTSTFTIWDRVSRYPVRCHFERSPESIEKVKGLLERRVIVRGRVRYFFNGIPRAVRDIASMEDTTPNLDLPPAYFGCIPDAEAARDPVAFLHSVRGVD